MSNKLFVGGLSFGMTDVDLEDSFKQYGEVLSAKIIFDKYTSRSRGFGFVEMSTSEAAQAAIEALNGSEIQGRTINVSVAKERSDNNRGFNNSGGFKQERDRDRY